MDQVYNQLFCPYLTGDSFKNGIPKVWGFTNAFLNLVEFHPEHAQNTILEAVHDKVGTHELRPLLQQVQEGMKLDQDLSKNFGLQPLAHELRLSEKVLKDCNFIRTENYNKVQAGHDVIPRRISNEDNNIEDEDPLNINSATDNSPNQMYVVKF